MQSVLQIPLSVLRAIRITGRIARFGIWPEENPLVNTAPPPRTTETVERPVPGDRSHQQHAPLSPLSAPSI